MRRQDPFFVVENINSGEQRNLRWVEDSSPGEVFADSGKGFLSLSLSSRKFKWLIFIIFLGLACLLAKTFYLQGIKGDHYFSMAEHNRLRTEYVKAHRGVIYDRQEKLLVQNVFGFSILITPANLPNDDETRSSVLSAVADMFSLDKKELESQVEEANKYYFQPMVVETGIDYERAMALKVASSDLPGISLEVDSWRNYTAGNQLSHLLGYVGKINAQEYDDRNDSYLLSDNIGKAGIEKYYEKCLRGTHGQRRVEVDAFGREKKIVSYEPFVAGCDLILTIDAGLQEEVYRVLERHLGKTKAASVIISDPRSGEILALVDYPSYDNNLFATGIGHDDYQSLLEDERKPLFGRSILGEYPSGSTIKPLIAAAALEEGVVTPQKNFYSIGGIWVADRWFFPDWKEGGHGYTNVYKAIAESVNTYFYYIGGGYKEFEGLGVGGINKYLGLFGLGQTSGIDLPGERSGLLPDEDWKREVKDEEWYIGDTYHLAIGQGDLLVTPLQVNNYNVAIANGGTLYQPHLVKSIAYTDGTTELIMPKTIQQNFISSDNIQAARQGMRQAVTYGSAVYLYDLPVKVAAKTGTAQWHNTKENHAWFNAFAPYDNPTIALTVLVEEGGEGSKIAAPIAKDILYYWFSK